MNRPPANPTPNLPPCDRRPLIGGAAAAGVFVLVLLVSSTHHLPMAWDEGNSIYRAEWIRIWGRMWLQPGPPDRPHPLSREAIDAHWRYTTQIEGHPALYGTLVAAGTRVGSWFLTPLGARRFGPVLLFAVAAGAMFYRMGRDYGRAAGVGAVLALVLQPRLFAHAQFALCDGPLTACWVLAWATFPSARGDWRKAVLLGVCLGMTMSTKATGWIAPAPLVAWTALYRDRRGALALAIGLPVALATFWLLNPPLWHQPIRGLSTFLYLNSHRELNVACFFLGRMYDLHHPLPWYNTLVWTAIVVPVGLLVLSAIGLVSVASRKLADRAGILLILNWAILLVVRALPGTPPHDGIRLILPAFAFLAAIAGIGTARLVAWRSPWDATLREHIEAWQRRWQAAPRSQRRKSRSKDAKGASDWAANFRLSVVVTVLLFAGSATSLFWYAPQWLSYYNLVIGGLPGATRAGMEPTYFWDALDREVLDWLEAHTADNEKVKFGSGAPENLAWMETWSMLRVHRGDAPGRPRWYIIQRRPSATMPPDQWLIANAEPAYKKYIHRYGYGPWRLNVPLLAVYRYEDYEAALQATTSSGPRQ